MHDMKCMRLKCFQETISTKERIRHLMHVVQKSKQLHSFQKNQMSYVLDNVQKFKKNRMEMIQIGLMMKLLLSMIKFQKTFALLQLSTKKSLNTFKLL